MAATPEQKQAVVVERLIDDLLDVQEVPGPQRYGVVYDAAAMYARQALEAEYTGEVEPFTWAIVSHQFEGGDWGYQAIEADTPRGGCVHTVRALDATVAQVWAIRAHVRNCGGER